MNTTTYKKKIHGVIVEWTPLMLSRWDCSDGSYTTYLDGEDHCPLYVDDRGELDEWPIQHIGEIYFARQIPADEEFKTKRKSSGAFRLGGQYKIHPLN